MAYGDAEDERKWLAKLHAQQTKALNDALSHRDYDQAKRVTGVPLTTESSHDADDLDEPERTEPQTAAEHFREHKHSLLYNLEWADGFLPRESLKDWWLRVEPLDLADAEAGLAAIEAIRDEYQHAVDRYEPSVSQGSRRHDWDYYVPRIGDEIEWVERL